MGYRRPGSPSTGCWRLCPRSSAWPLLYCLACASQYTKWTVVRLTPHPGYICLADFTIEVSLSLYGLRLAFFGDMSNTFNFVILLTDLALEVFDIIVSVSSVGSYVRLFRLLRMGRFLRILFISRECYMLAFGLGSTLQATMWAAGFLALVLTGWSTIAVEVIHPVNVALFREGAYGDCARCENAFASVMESNLTWFQTIVAGDSWGVLALPIMDRHPWTAFIFLPVYVTINFGLLNLILAVIVDRACEARQQDEQRCIDEKRKQLKEAKARLMVLCQAMDTDKSEYLSPEEIMAGYEDVEEFKDNLTLMDVRRSDLTMLMDILDADQDGRISYDEFCEELYKMKTQNEHTLLVMIKHLACDIQKGVSKEINSLTQLLQSKESMNEGKLDTLVSRLRAEDVTAEPSQPTTIDNDSPQVARVSDICGQGALSTTPGLHSIQQHKDDEVRRELELLRRRVEMDLQLRITEFGKMALNKSHANPWAPILASSRDTPPQVREDCAMISPVWRANEGQVVYRAVAVSGAAEHEHCSRGMPALPLSSCGISKCCGTKGVQPIEQRGRESLN